MKRKLENLLDKLNIKAGTTSYKCLITAIELYIKNPGKKNDVNIQSGSEST